MFDFLLTVLWIGSMVIAYLIAYAQGGTDKAREMQNSLEKELKRRSVEMEEHFKDEMYRRTRELQRQYKAD